MTDNFPDDLLKRYLQGRLSQTEREQLENRLNNEPELAEALALQRAEMASSELLIAAETRTWFAEWKQPEKAPFFKNKTVRWVLVVVAGISLVAAAVFLLNRPAATNPNNPGATPGPSPDIAAQQPAASPESGYLALAREYSEQPVRAAARQLSPADSKASPFRRAQAAYAAGQYQQTLDWLSQTDSTQAQSATFLKAHTFFQLKRFPEAAALFSRLIDTNSRQYRYSSEWGLLMCRLASYPQQAPEVRQQLQQITANPQHPYFEPAKKLQADLNE